MPDGRPSGSEPVQVRDLRPHEIPRQRGPGAHDEPNSLREGAYLVLARVLLASGATDRALGLLERLHAFAIAQGRTGNGIEAQALQAYPHGNVRVFADEGPTLGYLARLLPAFDAKHTEPYPGSGVAAAVPSLIEPLTARELEVLGLLAAGRSNRRIAAELVVTLDTVKKHVGRVLNKLGAANRTEAVARARQFGLLR